MVLKIGWWNELFPNGLRVIHWENHQQLKLADVINRAEEILPIYLAERRERIKRSNDYLKEADRQERIQGEAKAMGLI